jgi:hypothetical protein
MTLKEKVEEILKIQISDEDFKEAHSYAKHKLEWQNKHFGTNHGEYYLILLIADTYREQQFSKYTWELCKERMKKEEGVVLC